MENLSTESNALHAIIEDGYDRAREIVVNNLLPNERRELARQAQKLADLCDQVDREYRAAHGTCEVFRACEQSSVGYFYLRTRIDHPHGVCAEHRKVIEEEGVAVYEMPEVKL